MMRAMIAIVMTATMMEDQKTLLKSARAETLSQLNQVDDKLKAANISNCDDLSNKKRMLEEQVLSIDKELALRSKHLETAVKEQHRRRREALHKKLADRKAGATPPVSPKAGDELRSAKGTVEGTPAK